MAKRAYKRLPGRSRGVLSIGSLWMGNDHLLLVESSGFSETYRRFFYRDIQAVVICRTAKGLFTALVFGLLAAAFGAGALLAGGDAAIPLGVFSGAFLLIALILLVQGPTCRCTLRTAVQTQELPSLHHLRTARKVLRRIRPLVEAAQPETPAA